MNTRRDRPTTTELKTALHGLQHLATHMHRRREWSVRNPDLDPIHDAPIVIVPFVGAGASAAAGFPDGKALKQAIWKEVCNGRPKQLGHHDGRGLRSTANRTCALPRTQESALERMFRIEAREAFGMVAKKRMTSLSLFQMASLLSGTRYGREAINRCIHRSLPRGAGRPLCMELLAHLAKHDFIDDLVSLNFDSLLDEALRDELPDRIRVIDTPSEVPGVRAELRHMLREPASASSRVRYLLKPFGSIDVDKFRLSPEELRTYGDTSVWRFMLDQVFPQIRRTGMTDTVLLLVGYAAAEPAFEKLLRDLGHQRRTSVSVFSINPRPTLLPALQQALQRHLIGSVEHICLKADVALSLLVQMLKRAHEDHAAVECESWIPVARHEIVAECFGGHRQIDPAKRFASEVILQAVKARGFFTLETIAEISRISSNAHNAADELKALERATLLELHRGGPVRRGTLANLRVDFDLAIHDWAKLAKRFIATLGISDRKVTQWTLIGRDTSASAHSTEQKLSEFIAERFEAISSAPVIEVSTTASPSTPWMFTKARPISSVGALNRMTSRLLHDALDARFLEVTGIWETGEWLLHEKGWAFQRFGQQLIARVADRRARLRVVMASFGDHMKTHRGSRADAVRGTLDQLPESHCDVCYLDWWQHNRVLTLVRWGSSRDNLSHAAGIYFRRRHGSPVVSPVYVDGASGAPTDCGVLDDLYQYYCWKAGAAQTIVSSLPTSLPKVGSPPGHGNPPASVPGRRQEGSLRRSRAPFEKRPT